MSLLIALITIVVLAAVVAVSFALFKRSKYWKKQVERSLKMVPLLVTIPRDSGSKDYQATNRDNRDMMREIVSNSEAFYANLSVLYDKYKIFKNFFFGPPHFVAEIVAKDKEIFFYIAVPYAFLDVVKKGLSAQYPDAAIEQTEEHNIFNPSWGLDGVAGGEIRGANSYFYPIRTYQELDSEPLENITNTLSKLNDDEGAAIQYLIRPARPKHVKDISKAAKDKVGGKGEFSIWTLVDAVNGKDANPIQQDKLTPMEEEAIKAMERKTSKPNFEVMIRVVVAAQTAVRAQMVAREIESSFTQFGNQNLNSFSYRPARDTKELVTDYIFRFFIHRIFSWNHLFRRHAGYDLILNTEEIATIYHLPNYLVTTPGIRWLPSKKSAPPTFIPQEGAVIGHSNYRGEDKVIRIAENDRRRHLYILGQTGTGKSTSMINMIINDIRAGKGVCYIDPHGQDLVEHVLPYIPKERAEDVIIFDASDTERPIGLNLFDAHTPEEKDFVIQEAIAMLYRLYDPGHTGIMGPRFEHWFRNAALALMADPNGGTFIDVPKIFTDDAFLAKKLQYVTDPVVRNFWINEMGQTSDFHKSEMLGWFVGKFGAFMTNNTMRNIMGQTQSVLNFRQIMDEKKILLVNLSKGQVGEINIQLLGMILVAKIQMAAMSRVDIPESQRQDFYLYVDEFQNFATDSFASILSEARKFRLNLIVANQFIGQLKEDIRDAVFGNVGSLMCFRVGNDDAEYMSKQFAPLFNQQDLINIENYNSITKILIDAKPTRPFSLQGYDYPSGASKEVADAITQLSRLKHGRARDIVDTEIKARMGLSGVSAPPPPATEASTAPQPMPVEDTAPVAQPPLENNQTQTQDEGDK